MLTHILLVKARHVTNPLFSQGGNASTRQWVGVDNPLMNTKERETKYSGKNTNAIYHSSLFLALLALPYCLMIRQRR